MFYQIASMRGLCGALSYSSSVLASLAFGVSGFFMACRVCAVIWKIWGERNDWVFRGRERKHNEIWSLVRFHVFL